MVRISVRFRIGYFKVVLLEGETDWQSWCIRILSVQLRKRGPMRSLVSAGNGYAFYLGLFFMWLIAPPIGGE